MAKAATISLGVGLAVGVWLLIGLDASCQTRKGRFGVDVVIGGAMMLLIYIFMLGLTFDWLFTFGAIGIVLVLALLFFLLGEFKLRGARLMALFFFGKTFGIGYKKNT